ncbi:MAG: hypothetical protein ABW128_19710, partial [Rhizorhabdus sp.]
MIEDRFGPLVEALCEGEFALWIGSGISFGKAPGLPELVAAVIEFLRLRADFGDLAEPHHRALLKILGDHAKLSGADIAAQPVCKEFSNWPARERIVEALRNNYSPMLDERVKGQKPDYLLWEAVNVVGRYAGLDEPDAEHRAIAILVFEGAIKEMASGNWDGLIEAAIAEMSPVDPATVLRTVVEPDDMRGHRADATLVKFHGCAMRCANDNDRFRPFLIATEARMIEWANEDGIVQLELRRIATTYRSLVVGLSLQDGNLKSVFDKAKRTHPWNLPAPPEPPAHVFLEEALGAGQRTILKLVYGANFDADPDLVEASALLRARPKTAPPVLALHVVLDKIHHLALGAAAHLGTATPIAFARGIATLRTLAASAAPDDRSETGAFVERCVLMWTRCMSLLRTGQVPNPASRNYLAVSPRRRGLMAGDLAVAPSGLPQFSASLALMGELQHDGTLTLAAPAAPFAAITARGSYAGADPRHVTFVGNAAAAFELKSQGAFDDRNAVFVHSDGKILAALGKRRRSPSGAS